MRLQLVKQRQRHSKEDRQSGEGFEPAQGWLNLE